MGDGGEATRPGLDVFAQRGVVSFAQADSVLTLVWMYVCTLLFRAIHALSPTIRSPAVPLIVCARPQVRSLHGRCHARWVDAGVGTRSSFDGAGLGSVINPHCPWLLPHAGVHRCGYALCRQLLRVGRGGQVCQAALVFFFCYVLSSPLRARSTPGGRGSLPSCRHRPMPCHEPRLQTARVNKEATACAETPRSLEGPLP